EAAPPATENGADEERASAAPAPLPEAAAGERATGAEAERASAAVEPARAAAEAEAPRPPDLEAVRREAFERGVAEGRAALPWTDAEALRAAVRAFTAAASELATARRSYLLENRHVVVELACAI